MEEDIKILEKFLCTSNLSFGDSTRYAFALRRIKDRYRELEENLKIATAMLTKGTYPPEEELNMHIPRLD